MTLSVEERKLLIQHNIKKADEIIEEIVFYISNDKLFTAVNRIYYGLFYMLTALSLQEGIISSKHMQLISWFNKTFIHGKLVEEKYGKIIRNIFEQRSKADYDVLSTFSREQVESIYEDMKDTVNMIKGLIMLKPYIAD